MYRREDSKASKAHISTLESEPSDKARKDKKKKQYKDRKNSKEPRDFIIPANGINTAEIGDEKRKKKKKKKDASEVTCYNCNKLGYYADKCLKPKGQKTSIALNNLHIDNWF